MTSSGLTAEQKLSTAVGLVSSTKAINTIDNAYGVKSDKAFVQYIVPHAEGKLEVKKVVTNDKFIKPITTSFYDEQFNYWHSYFSVNRKLNGSIFSEISWIISFVDILFIQIERITGTSVR